MAMKHTGLQWRRSAVIAFTAVLLAHVAHPLCAQSGDIGLQLVEAARRQIGVTMIYDPAYVRLAWPGGDVPLERGVCTDVVIRALRDAWKVDLQVLVHEDMVRHFSDYPRKWGRRRPDPNIDHRRVLNLRVWFRRQGLALPVKDSAGAYRPGDIVTSTLPGNLPHIMIVSDRTSSTGTPLVIHNIGSGAREEDALFAFPLTGHYRFTQAGGAK